MRYEQSKWSSRILDTKILSAGEDNFCVKTENGDRGEDGIGSWRQPAAPLRRWPHSPSPPPLVESATPNCARTRYWFPTQSKPSPPCSHSGSRKRNTFDDVDSERARRRVLTAFESRLRASAIEQLERPGQQDRGTAHDPRGISKHKQVTSNWSQHHVS